MTRFALFLSVMVALTGSLFAAGDDAPSITVYTHRHYDADAKLYAEFEKETGIQVNSVKASADQLIQRLETEGANSPADVLITVDAGRLQLAKEKGLLQPATSEVLEAQVPANLRDPEGNWYGVTMRGRVVVYAKDRVKPSELSTYEALATKPWQGRVLVRSSSNVYNQSLLASIIVANGETKARGWVRGIVNNFARTPKGNDRDQIKAVVAGAGDVAIVNTYYLGLLLNSEDEADRTVGSKVGVFFPNQGEGERGAHINVSGAGVTASSKNKANAIKFLEFLTGKHAQATFAEANYEYPVNPAVPPSALLKSWGEFRADSVNLAKLGELNAAAVRLFDEEGWR